jgi:hypothetical protein
MFNEHSVSKTPSKYKCVASWFCFSLSLNSTRNDFLPGAQVSHDPLVVSVEHLKEEDYDEKSDFLKALSAEIVATMKELLHMHPLYNEQLKAYALYGSNFQNLSQLSDMGASLTSADDVHTQAILEELRIPERSGPCLMFVMCLWSGCDAVAGSPPGGTSHVLGNKCYRHTNIFRQNMYGSLQLPIGSCFVKSLFVAVFLINSP